MQKNLKDTEKQLSVLFVGTQIATGGAQKLLLAQARWFHDHGHRITAAFFYDRDNLLADWQAQSPFPIQVMLTNTDGKKPGPIGVLIAWWNLWKLFRDGRFAVVQTFTRDSNILALPIAWLAGVRVRIATRHNVRPGGSRWREIAETFIVNSGVASVLVAVSKQARENAQAEGVRQELVIVINNSIAPLIYKSPLRADVRAEFGLNEETLLLITVGRLVFQKAHDLLVSAMPKVLSRFRGARLLICGEGELRADLESRILAFGLEKEVRLLGQRDDIGQLLFSADIFVLPSRWEGLPIALLEAMSASLPVVATNFAGADEVITHGEHGLLVPVDDAAQLADAIIQLAADPTLRANLGQASRQRIEEYFSLEHMCEEYLKLMNGLLWKSHRV